MRRALLRRVLRALNAGLECDSSVTPCVPDSCTGAKASAANVSASTLFSTSTAAPRRATPACSAPDTAGLEESQGSPEPSAHSPIQPPVSQLLTSDFRMSCQNKAPQEHLDTLSTSLMQYMDVLGPHAIANILHSCRRAQYLNRNLIAGLLEAIIAHDQFDEFDPIQIAMTVQSLGMLSRLLRSTSGVGMGDKAKEVSIILSSALSKRDAVNGRVLANVLHGLGNLFPKERGVEVNPTVVNCMEVLGGLACRQDQMEFYTGQGLSNIVYSWGVIGWSSEEHLDAMCQEIAKPKRLGEFKEQELANIVYGLGVLGYTNEELVVDVLVETIKGSRLSKYQNQELSNVVHGIAAMTRAEGGKALVFTLQPIIQRLKKEASNDARMSRYNPTDLAMLVWGFGVMDADETGGLTNMLVDRFVFLSRKRYVSKENLAKILQICARRKARHRDLVKLANEAILGDKVDLGSSFTITWFMWCLVRLNALQQRVFLKLCRLLIRMKAGGEELSPQSSVQLSQVIVHMGAEKDTIVLDEDLNRLFDETLGVQKHGEMEFGMTWRDSRGEEK